MLCCSQRAQKRVSIWKWKMFWLILAHELMGRKSVARTMIFRKFDNLIGSSLFSCFTVSSQICCHPRVTKIVFANGILESRARKKLKICPSIELNLPISNDCKGNNEENIIAVWARYHHFKTRKEMWQFKLTTVVDRIKKTSFYKERMV